ncbi:MAG: DUF1648 domain-containing protein [Catenulispora sp.]|nr:DUF1648 domain-containing protein [Catenulispora sp.]
MIPIALIGAVTLVVPLMTPPTVQFGVRIPAERGGDAALAGARRGYRLGIVGVTVAALLVALFVPGGAAARLSGVLVEVVGVYAVYLVARAHVSTAKHEGRWFEGRKQVTVADTALRTRPDPFPWLWGLPAAVIVVGTAVFGAIRYPHLPDRLAQHYNTSGHPTSYTDKTFVSAFAPVGAQLAVVALMVALTWITFHGKATLDAQDPHAADRQRRFVAVMSRCLLLFAAAVGLTMFFAALATWNVLGSTGWFPVILLAPAMLATLGLIVVALRVGQGGSRLRYATTADEADSAAEPAAVNRDDDHLWKGGILYYNRDDPSVFVQKRFGFGWTLNWARPAALVFLVAVTVVPLLLPWWLR